MWHKFDKNDETTWPPVDMIILGRNENGDVEIIKLWHILPEISIITYDVCAQINEDNLTHWTEIPEFKEE